MTIPESEATPDEAYDLGKVAGYDEAMREVFGQAGSLGNRYRNDPDSAVWADGTKMSVSERIAVSYGLETLLAVALSTSQDASTEGQG